MSRRNLEGCFWLDFWTLVWWVSCCFLLVFGCLQLLKVIFHLNSRPSRGLSTLARFHLIAELVMLHGLAEKNGCF